MMPTRLIHHADAITWLREQPTLQGCSVVTSLPDVSEFASLNLSEWKAWFVEAARLVFSRCPDDGVSIFYQSDIKRDGVWIDKGFLIQKAAESIGHELIYHKIICRSQPSTVTYGPPGYSHLLCFSKSVRMDLSKSTPDVLPLAGKTTWTRGMGIEACKLACQIIAEHTSSHTIIDPFCGHGTVLAVANDFGFNAVGVEVVRKRAKIAQNLSIESLAGESMEQN